MGCDNCIYKDRIKVPYIGNKISDIMFVGEAPASEEIKQGKPFMGRSGQLLDKLLSSVNLSRQDVYIANSCKCQIDKEVDSTKDINSAMVNCREYLIKAINQVKPKLIVCLGAYALKQILGKQKITENCGKFFDVNGYKVFVTVHPAYVLRGASKDFPNIPYDAMSMKEKMIFNNFKEISKFINNGFKNKKIKVNYKEATITEIDAYNKSKILATDFETLSVDTHDPKNKVLCESFCNKIGDSKVVFFNESIIGKEAIKDVLSNENVAKVVASRPFDESVSRNMLGIEMKGKVYDVLTMAHILDENNHSYSLESVSNIYSRLKNIKSIIGDKRGNLGETSKQELLDYNAQDSDATLDSYLTMKEIYSKPENKRLANYYLNFMCPIQDMFADISNNGVLINQKKLKSNEQKISKLMRELYVKAMQKVPNTIKEKYKDNLNFTRDALIVEYLFTKNGLNLKPKMVTSKKETPSTSEEHLSMFSHVPFVEYLLEWKKYQKIASSYLSNLWNFIKQDGRVYPQTLFTRQTTGRCSMTEPSIQTIPQREGLYANLVKSVYVADDGWLFGARDLAQSELRIIGWVAKDPNILGALKKGIDLHSRTVTEVIYKKKKLNIEDVTKEMRQAAKAVNFGFIYGMCANSFKYYAERDYSVKFTDQQCADIRQVYFSKPDGYYMLPVYHEQEKFLCKKNGYVESPLGRRRRLSDIYSNDYSLRGYAERQAINFPIQSMSSDLGLLGMYLMWKEIKSNPKLNKNIKPLWHIHDNEMFMAKEDYIDKAHELLKECMEERVKEYIKKYFGVNVDYPIESEGKQGDNWASMKK